MLSKQQKSVEVYWNKNRLNTNIANTNNIQEKCLESIQTRGHSRIDKYFGGKRNHIFHR